MASTFLLLVMPIAALSRPQKLANVLYIVVDDLRPEMHLAYNQSHIITPNFDKLAQRGLTFSRAYCQIAVCAPSRSSFMSGIRPDASGIFNFHNHIRDAGQPKITTLPGQFLKHNYTVLGGGKTFHFDHPPYFDDIGPRGSWSSSVAKYYPFNEFGGSTDMARCPIPEGYVQNPAKLNPQVCALDVPMETFYDYRLATHTIQTLRLVANGTNPWFVMAGFRRPHRVFKVHKQYYDLYPADPSDIAVAKVQRRDASQPEIAFHHGDFTLANGSYYPGNADKPWPKIVQQIARKGYYAAVTQTDAQVGRVLAELDSLGLTNSTLVVLHSDHGWQLGERGEWDKQTNFEAATRVPLIISVPWASSSHGKHTKSFTDLVDMHPTVASLAGLPFTPPMALGSGLDSPTQAFGTDVSRLLHDDSLRDDEEISGTAEEVVMLKNVSYSQWPSCGVPDQQGMCISSRAVLTAMGYSVRVDGWRYTAWVKFNNGSSADPTHRTFTADWTEGALLAVELYDKRSQDAATTFDFDDDGEVKNLALMPGASGHQSPDAERMQKVLHAMLVRQFSYDAGWLAARRQRFISAELRYDKNMGFTPYA